MSQGDLHQQHHDTAGALRARLVEIATGTANYHVYHQTAVLLSELAETAYRNGDPRSLADSETLLLRAMQYLDTARQTTPPTQQVALLAIECDRHVAEARWQRLQPDRPDTREQLIATADTLAELAGSYYAPSTNAEAWHQAAIAFALTAMLAWGDVLGLKGGYNEQLVITCHRRAMRYFDEERHHTPDAERAYRSHLLWMAQGYRAIGRHVQADGLTHAAIVSAKRHKDDGHRTRARVALLLGNRGETGMRKRKHNDIIRALRNNL